MILTPEGEITAIEKTIAAKDLPRAVTDALANKYAKAKVNLAEEVTKGEKVSYEVQLVLEDGSRAEVLFDAQGKVLKEERQKKEKKD